MDDFFEDEPAPSLYLVRMARDSVEGLKIEPVPRHQLEIDHIARVRIVLARQLLQNELRVWPLILEEFDERVNCKAMIHRDYAADFSSWVAEHGSYNYSGYGPGASGFGYDSADTVAWIIPHASAPAIFWRFQDEYGSGRVMTWLNRMADDIEDGIVTEIPPFPKLDPAVGKGELLIPDEALPPRSNHRGRYRRVGTF